MNNHMGPQGYPTTNSLYLFNTRHLLEMCPLREQQEWELRGFWSERENQLTIKRSKR
jgi:hypothetical protein